MSENNTNTYNEEEISLLDLFAVLLRYRKLIIITTAVAFVLSVLYLFALPKVLKTQSETDVLVIHTLAVEKMAPELSSYLNVDLASLSEREFRDYFNFATTHKPYNIFTDEDKDLTARQYNTAVKKLIDDKKDFIVSTNRSNNTITVTATIPESKVDTYNDFLKEYVTVCSELVEEKVEQAIESAQNNIEELMSRNEASEITVSDKADTDLDTKSAKKIQGTSSDLSKLVSMQLAIKTFTDTHTNIISVAAAPFEADAGIGQRRVIKIIIATFAAFFLSVFLAFLLNAIANIKKDPEASKLISDAWKAGK